MKEHAFSPGPGDVQGILDSALAEGALQELPFMQTTVKLAKAHALQGDHRLARRTARFLARLQDVPDKAPQRVIETMKVSHEGQWIGETLVSLLCRADDTRKADLLAVLLKCYMSGAIGWPAFQVLADAIDRCSVDDLAALRTLASGQTIPAAAAARLLAVGLAEPAGASQLAGCWSSTELGQTLLDLALDSPREGHSLS